VRDDASQVGRRRLLAAGCPRFAAKMPLQNFGRIVEKPFLDQIGEIL
jgi:hypothetical protein